MQTEKIDPDKDPYTTEKKIRNVRTFLYLLVLIFITKIAMMDFYEPSFRPWLDVVIILLVILFALAIEKSLRNKLKKENDEKGY